eukprot:TRINITY_DN25861_c0_g1_i3.p1 TRINITY_DN25861_c0_g1~~TRINITY_DN25861_c0_g1_i3.p1  ORF type:complete len:227 (+),score=76.92 TRINITY_DN25861_c0_g1_i3:63-743(+)
MSTSPGRRRSWCIGDGGRSEFQDWVKAHAQAAPSDGAESATGGGYSSKEAPAAEESEQLKKAAEFGLMLLQKNQALEEEMKHLHDELEHSRELNNQLKDEVMQAKLPPRSRPTAQAPSAVQLQAVEEMEDRMAQLDSEVAVMSRKHTEAVQQGKMLQRQATIHEGKVKDMETELQKAKNQENVHLETIATLQTELELRRRQCDEAAFKRKAATSGRLLRVLGSMAC